MKHTGDIIQKLAGQAVAVRPMPAPHYWAVRIFAVLAAYALGSQAFLGLRPDLMAQMMRPLFALEIVLLAAVVITSTLACIIAMYPDVYQKSGVLHMPLWTISILCVVILIQLVLEHDTRMAMPGPDAHAIECALCIASVALVPTVLLLLLTRRGASVYPIHSGAFCVLAATAIGCLTLRLAEMNDSIIHLLSWHYVPTLLFAMLGAWVGKYMFKW